MLYHKNRQTNKRALNKTYFDHIHLHDCSQSKDENHKKAVENIKTTWKTVNVLSFKMISNNLNYIFALLKIEFIWFEFFLSFRSSSTLNIVIRWLWTLLLSVWHSCKCLSYSPLFYFVRKRKTNKFLLLFFVAILISFICSELFRKNNPQCLKFCCSRHRCVLFCYSTTCKRKVFLVNFCLTIGKFFFLYLEKLQFTNFLDEKWRFFGVLG